MKTTTIKLRISPEDKARWEANASAAGESLSEYVRGMVEVGQAEAERIAAIHKELERDHAVKLAK